MGRLRALLVALLLGTAVVAVPATAHAYPGETKTYCGGPIADGWVIIFEYPNSSCWAQLEQITGLTGSVTVCQGSPVPTGWRIAYSGFTQNGCTLNPGGVGYGMALVRT